MIIKIGKMSIVGAAIIIVRGLIEMRQRRLNDRDSEGGFLPPRGHGGGSIWERVMRWLADQHKISSMPKFSFFQI